MEEEKIPPTKAEVEEKFAEIKECPECGGQNLYILTEGPYFDGQGFLMYAPKMTLKCRDCESADIVKPVAFAFFKTEENPRAELEKRYTDQSQP